MLEKVLMMNTSYNTSQYINNDVKAKAIDALNKERLARSGVHKARYSYMQKKYTIGSNKFMTGVFQGSILVACIAATLIAFNKMKSLGTMFVALTVAIVVAMFLFIVAMMARNNLTRRVDDWDKFYFGPHNMNDIK
jgi:ABC-type dipeptide/oligopeptide/nickel transport system permease component